MQNAVFNHLVKIHDIYFISDIIKEIDSNYRLYYNALDNRYEVHDISKPYKTSLCITSRIYPDQRMIIKLITTRRENMNRLLKQIEVQNAKLLSNSQDKICNLAKDQLTEVINYSSLKPTRDLTKDEIKKIINK